MPSAARARPASSASSSGVSIIASTWPFLHVIADIHEPLGDVAIDACIDRRFVPRGRLAGKHQILTHGRRLRDDDVDRRRRRKRPPRPPWRRVRMQQPGNADDRRTGRPARMTAIPTPRLVRRPVSERKARSTPPSLLVPRHSIRIFAMRGASRSWGGDASSCWVTRLHGHYLRGENQRQRLRWRRNRRYMVGTKINVASVANRRPPITALPRGAFCSPPSPMPSAIGTMPRIIAPAVISTGRSRV